MWSDGPCHSIGDSITRSQFSSGFRKLCNVYNIAKIWGLLNSVPPPSGQLGPTLTADDKALNMFTTDTDISTFHEYDFIHLNVFCHNITKSDILVISFIASRLKLHPM